jgi:hypothetical protein
MTRRQGPASPQLRNSATTCRCRGLDSRLLSHAGSPSISNLSGYTAEFSRGGPSTKCQFTKTLQYHHGTPLLHINPSGVMALGPYWNLRVDQYDRVYVITMQKAPENRINVRFAQEIIRALRDIEHALGPDSDGCVITRGNDEKYWCTGLELDESDTNPNANSDGFFPVSQPAPQLKLYAPMQPNNPLTLSHTAPRNPPRLPVPDHRPANRPHLRRRVPLRARARLPHHERDPRLHQHATREPRPALPGHRIPPAAQALAARGAQDAARGAPVDGRRGVRRRHRRCACGARGYVGRCAGDGEGAAGARAHGRV